VVVPDNVPLVPIASEILVVAAVTTFPAASTMATRTAGEIVEPIGALLGWTVNVSCIGTDALVDSCAQSNAMKDASMDRANAKERCSEWARAVVISASWLSLGWIAAV
jgi:hypothetical protein